MYYTEGTGGGGRGEGTTHDLDDGLPAVLNGHVEGGLEAGGGLAQDEERLVRAAGLATLLGSQGDLEGIGATEGEGPGRGGGLGEPAGVSDSAGAMVSY